MPKLELSYFDFHGGRGEPARLALYIGGIDFEDNRLGFAEWSKLKPSTPFGSMPLLEVDGQLLTQCNAINRYVGKLAGLYPEDRWQAALCDEVMDVVEDITHKLTPTFMMKDEAEKKAARQALADGPISLYLKAVAGLLQQHGGQYFADAQLTVADLKVFGWIRHLRSGKLDHVPTDLPDRVAPALVQHHDRIAAHPKIAQYYAARGGYK